MSEAKSLPTAPPKTPDQVMLLMRGLGGAVVGGILGYLLFWALARSGMLGYMIPGALLGLGAGYAAGGKSQVLGAICAVLGLGLTLFTAWHIAFQHVTFVEFVTSLHKLHLSRQVLMALGVVMAYWFGQGR